MKKYTAEDIVMNLVCNGGDCRSKALEAIQAARKGNFEQADALMAQAQQSMHLAHNFQTELIQAEMREDESEKAELSLLMVHGQDHLMDGMVVYDLASEIIEILPGAQTVTFNRNPCAGAAAGTAAVSRGGFRHRELVVG